MSDYSVSYESGLAIYSLALDPVAGTAWDGSAWVDRSANWSACAVAMTDTGNNLYEGAIPETVPSGTYLVQSYLQVGGSPAESDPLVGTGTVVWPGTTEPLPGSEFSVEYESGHTLNAILWTDEGTAWNGVGFAVPTPETWESFLLPMVDGGDGTYTGHVPIDMPPGTYTARVYLQEGADPASTDPVVGLGSIVWEGSGELPPAGGFRAALVAKLNGDVMLANLVGDRIWPQVRPQRGGGPSGLVWTVPSIDRDHDLDGPTGLATAYAEFTAYADDFVLCDQIGRRLRDLLDGFTGILGFGVEVTETLSDSDLDDWDTPVDGSDDGTYSIQVDYQITYRESTPNRGS